MKPIATTIVTSFLFLVVTSIMPGVVSTADAASPKYKRGGTPLCSLASSTDANGVTTVTATCSAGEVAGLGNFDVTIKLSILAAGGTLCFAPGDTDQSNPVPGQNPATATSTSITTIEAEEIKNGTLVVPATSTTATFTVNATTAGCPNTNWTAIVDADTLELSGTYTFESPPGTVIDKLSFTF